MSSPRLTVREIRLFERDIVWRLPFRFGSVTVREATLAFARVRVEVEGGGSAWGVASEMLAPKWFDKQPGLSEADTVDQLRLSLRLAAARYISSDAAAAFGMHAAAYQSHLDEAAGHGMPSLAAGFGLAVLDRAVLDALARQSGVGLAGLMAANLPGINAELTPDLAEFDLRQFLASRKALSTVQARHTVGMLDPLDDADLTPDDRLNDGLPETLEQVVDFYGVRYFKLKIGGDLEADIDRLRGIARVLDARAPGYQSSIDGNEQYRDWDSLAELMRRISGDPELAGLRSSLIYMEQPVAREVAADLDVSDMAGEFPLLVDESDGDISAFKRFRALGYESVSIKGCKGVYKAILNAARCQVWNAEEGRERYFLTAEDLSCQAGLGVQQDMALISWLGIEHCERNGHHYGFGMRDAPALEQSAFLNAYPALYRQVAGVTCLAINEGGIDTGDLSGGVGWASAAEPDWDSLRPVGEFER